MSEEISEFVVGKHKLELLLAKYISDLQLFNAHRVEIISILTQLTVHVFFEKAFCSYA